MPCKARNPQPRVVTLPRFERAGFLHFESSVMDFLWEWGIILVALAPVLSAVTLLRAELREPRLKKALGSYLGVVALTFTPLVLALGQWLLFRPDSRDWFQPWGWMQIMAFIPGALVGGIAWIWLVWVQSRILGEKRGQS